MKKLIFFLAAIVALSSCTRIDAGHEGIKVNMYGTDKGVSDVVLVTGRVWYNPFTEDVYEIPTYVQTADYEAFTVNAKDGSVFVVDPLVSYKVTAGKTPDIFVKYRKSVEEIQSTVLLTYTRDAFKNIFNRYPTDSILSKREQFDREVTALLTEELEKEGFHVEQLTFGMQYPESMTNAINAKNAAIQNAQKAENELRVAEANAKILVTNAKAQKEANDLLQQSLTPQLINKMFIEKWDGSTPLYGQSPLMFKNVQ
jgi:regulator of protease activity HflC (stomatin/prohibitin superfamily)